MRVTPHLLVAFTLACCACSDDPSVPAAPDSGSEVDLNDHDSGPDVSDLGADSGTTELRANAGVSLYALVGDEVVLDASASTGAVEYEWNFGDGNGWDEPRDTPVATTTYTQPGRYQAVLTAYDAEGRKKTDSAVISVTHPAEWEPVQSGTIALLGDSTFAVAVPDADQVSGFVAGQEGFSRAFTVDCPGAATVATGEGGFWATCQRSDELVFIESVDDVWSTERVALDYGSNPYGVVADDGDVWVTAWGDGELLKLSADSPPEVIAEVPDARHLALLPDGRVSVSRWRSPDERGELYIVGAETEVWPLRFDPQPASDTETGGVPSYLGPLAVSPTGREAAVPSLQANIDHGLFRNGQKHTHENLMRAVVSFVDLESGSEKADRRKQYDDRGFANHAVFSRRGDFLWVAMRGNRTIERYDMLNSGESGTIFEVGFAPESIALSSDGDRLFVDASLSREVRVYDVSDVAAAIDPVEVVSTVANEPLPADVLRGKILFNDAQDPRLTLDGYVACAHCHLDGLSDNRTWDFTDRGEGLRNTTSLVGRAGDEHGPIHWSGNFDEIHDFEHDIRGPFAGAGLMTDDEFTEGNRADPLGDSKAGISEDLDALAAYLGSLDGYLSSPHRAADGSLSTAAQAGKAIFESAEAGCTTCHAGPHLTDSQWVSPRVPLLHDVGTLTMASGERLGDTLIGIDTPTLFGLWNSGPYLHDGSAADLLAVLVEHNVSDSHGKTSHLTEDELSQLVEYLLSLDGSLL